MASKLSSYEQHDIQAIDLTNVDMILIGYGDTQMCEALVARAETLRKTLSTRRVVVVINPSLRFDSMFLENLSLLPDVKAMDWNQGYAAAFNKAVASIKEPADYLVVTTDDCQLDKDQLAKLVLTLDMNPEAWAVGPKIVFAGANECTYGGFHKPSGRIGHHRSPSSSVDWIDGACIVFRSSALKKLGTLPESLFLYFEDTFIGLQIASLGGLVLCDNEVTVKQSSGRRTRPLAFGYFDSRNRILLADLCNVVSRPVQCVISLGRICTAALLSAAPRLESRRRQRRIFLGRVVGFVDGIRGLDGPPPEWIQRRTGIANTHKSSP